MLLRLGGRKPTGVKLAGVITLFAPAAGAQERFHHRIDLRPDQYEVARDRSLERPRIIFMLSLNGT